MSSSLIRGRYVICKITGPDSAQVVSDGAVYQRDGAIVEVGPYEDLRQRHPDAEVIGSSSYVVMPGLVNDHFHVGFSPFQMGSPDLPLELWQASRMGARRIDPYLDQIYGAIQMIESGTTTVQAIHGGAAWWRPMDLEVADKAVGAFQNSGMRVSYAPSVADQDATVSGARGGEAELAAQMPPDLAERYLAPLRARYRPVEDLMAALEEICQKYGNDRYERVRITMAPSNVHRCSDALLDSFRRMATKYSTGIHIHLLETIYQKEYGARLWNKSPLQHLYDLGFLGHDVVCGHSVWVSEDDIDIMASTGTNVCHNASSNLRLQSGIAPVGPLLRKNIRIAIGSDEAGLNDDKDLFQEMRLVLKIHRVPGVENVPPTSYQVFRMGTEHGAYASWFGDKVGTLEPGKRADVVLLNLQNIEEPYLDPDVSIVDAVVHRGRSIDVDTVIVDGEVVMRDRKLTKIDKEALYAEFKKALDRPLEPGEADSRALGREVIPYMQRFYEGTLPDNPVSHSMYNARR